MTEMSVTVLKLCSRCAHGSAPISLVVGVQRKDQQQTVSFHIDLAVDFERFASLRREGAKEEGKNTMESGSHGDKIGALVDEIDALVDWQLSQKPADVDFLDTAGFIRAHRYDYRRFMEGEFRDDRDVRITAHSDGYRTVRTIIWDRHDDANRGTWLDLTPDEARRLAESLIWAAEYSEHELNFVRTPSEAVRQSDHASGRHESR